MPVDIPNSAEDVVSRSKADVQRELSQSDPFLKNAWLGAIITGFAHRIYDFYLQLYAESKQNFPDTAVGEALTRWAAIWGITPIAATKASGYLVATGVIGAVFPAGKLIGKYVSTDDSVVASSTVNVDTFMRLGSTVTVTTTGVHGLANGLFIDITGATNVQFNLTTSVLAVVSSTVFTYEIETTPADEVITSATVRYSSANVPVTASDYGEVGNSSSGVNIRLQQSIPGINDQLTVGFEGVTGGNEKEDEEAVRARMLNRIQNPTALFNVAAIKEKAFEIAGVTRVFVFEATQSGFPALGQVAVYFMKDGQSNPIPSSTDIVNVKAKINEIRPANVWDVNVIVGAPNSVPVNFTFTGYGPPTSSMRDAIKANLQLFFEEGTSVGEDVQSDAYRSAIFNTIDTSNGDKVENFTLSSPSGDVSIATGEIGVLGSVVFP